MNIPGLDVIAESLKEILVELKATNQLLKEIKKQNHDYHEERKKAAAHGRK